MSTASVLVTPSDSAGQKDGWSNGRKRAKTARYTEASEVLV